MSIAEAVTRTFAVPAGATPFSVCCTQPPPFDCTVRRSSDTGVPITFPPPLRNANSNVDSVGDGTAPSGEVGSRVSTPPE